ncbi:MAG TPA: hypothetical protein VM097_13805 [Mycobacteriales bacterium]|nr:hypothetical protein [Mycobacteriales bacterium]
MRATRVLVASLLLLPGTAAADQVELPTSDAAQLAATAILRQLPNFRPDRLLPSDVPGPVTNDEVVRVGVGGDGTVRRVVLEQRLRLQGTGDYAVRERGPAREATSLSDDPAPVTRRGAVVWQGFSPGFRDLAARLLLDPQIEAVHLPLGVTVSFSSGGTRRPLEPGGRVPGPGTITLSVKNLTEQPAVLPTGSDVSASAVAGSLDQALRAARRPSAARLASTDAGLPKTLEVQGAAQVQATQAVPFRLTGTIRLLGTTGAVSGPATEPLTDGAGFAGVLGGVDGAPEVTFSVRVDGPGTLALDLTAVAALDARALAPPRGLSSWRAWARSSPPQGERKAALDLLVQVAATGARASSYSPYLGADLLGSGSTSFSYAFAPAERAATGRPHLEPRWGAISLAALALLLVLTNAGLIWRRL